jgi:hypothetical protein
MPNDTDLDMPNDSDPDRPDQELDSGIFRYLRRISKKLETVHGIGRIGLSGGGSSKGRMGYGDRTLFIDFLR